MSYVKKDICLLLARLIIGGIFITTGWMKVSAIDITIGYFSAMHIAPVFAYVVGYSELVGGILLILGLWSCLAIIVLGVIMIFAVYYSYPLGFQMYMSPLAVLGALLAILGSGAGKYSISFKKKFVGLS